ncbi:MAG TPA: hypothetical protein VFE62_28685 [Gemmataceae bacterium]|nr:hypothetical protein [Gemmataceae bacterium]
MSVPDMALAGRLARMCACLAFADKPRRMTASRHFADAGFTDLPRAYFVDTCNACMVATAGAHVVLAFSGGLPLSFASTDELLCSLHAWLSDSDRDLIAVDGITGLVQRGFAASLRQLWSLFMEELQDRLRDGKKLIVTGYSAGGAVAALAASRLVGMELADAPVLYTFAAPRAGNSDFAAGVLQRVQEAWRFEYGDDCVPHLHAHEPISRALRKHQPHLGTLQLPHLAPVGSLEFIHRNGKIISTSESWLDNERAGQFANALSAGNTNQLGADHSLESYLPAIKP